MPRHYHRRHSTWHLLPAAVRGEATTVDFNEWMPVVSAAKLLQLSRTHTYKLIRDHDPRLEVIDTPLGMMVSYRSVATWRLQRLRNREMFAD